MFEKNHISKAEKGGELIKDMRNGGNMYVLSGLSDKELVERATKNFRQEIYL